MHTHSHIQNHSQLAANRITGVTALLLCSAAGVLGLPSPALAQVGLGLSPMRVELNAPAGSQRAGALSISNSAPVDTRYRTEILDFNLDQEATPQFEPDLPVESEYSCRQWLTFNPMEAAIPAEGNGSIRYTLRIPANALPRTYHCAVGFTSLPPVRKPQDTAVGMVSVVRVVNTFYITVGDPRPEGELKAIVLEKVVDPNTAGLRAIFRVENTGLTNLRGDGKVDVLDSTGKIIETEDFPTSVILPKRTQRVPLVLRHKLSDGDYTLRARVNLGTGEIQEATIGFRPPAAAPSASPLAQSAQPVPPAAR